MIDIIIRNVNTFHFLVNNCNSNFLIFINSFQKQYMKDFHTSINIRGVHIVNYFNWEEKLDRLYRKVVNPSNLCYGIVSNSERISKTDQYGKLSNGLTYRFHNKIDTLSHANITQLSRIEFDRIFKNYDSLSDEEKCDFYHLEKNQGFYMEILVYPLVGKDNKKCLILFNFDKSKQDDLDKMTEAIYKFIDD